MLVTSDGVIGRVRRAVSMIVEVLRIRGGRGGRGFAEMIRSAAAGEMIHPGGEASIIAVGMPVLEHPLKNDLGNILRRGAVTDELGKKSEERPVVALEQFAQRIEFPVTDREHQFMVRQRFDGGLHEGRMVFNHVRL